MKKFLQILDFVLVLFVMFVTSLAVAALVKECGFTGIQYYRISIPIGTVLDVCLWASWRYYKS